MHIKTILAVLLFSSSIIWAMSEKEMTLEEKKALENKFVQAIKKCDEQEIKKCIANKVNVNMRCADNDFPLRLAVLNGKDDDLNIIKILRKAGCNTGLKKALGQAVWQVDVKIIEYFLSIPGIEVDVDVLNELSIGAFDGIESDEPEWIEQEKDVATTLQLLFNHLSCGKASCYQMEGLYTLQKSYTNYLSLLPSDLTTYLKKYHYGYALSNDDIIKFYIPYKRTYLLSQPIQELNSLLEDDTHYLSLFPMEMRPSMKDYLYGVPWKIEEPKEKIIREVIEEKYEVRLRSDPLIFQMMTAAQKEHKKKMQTKSADSSTNTIQK
jgi:hypothetical protein